MARYEGVVRKSVTKDLRALPNADVTRLLAAIKSLAKDPRPAQSKRLSASEKYRVRCGDYRILYTIEDERLTVTVVKLGHRKDVYRGEA